MIRKVYWGEKSHVQLYRKTPKITVWSSQVLQSQVTVQEDGWQRQNADTQISQIT